MQTNKYPQDLVLEGYGVKLKRLTHDNQLLVSLAYNKKNNKRKNKYPVTAA